MRKLLLRLAGHLVRALVMIWVVATFTFFLIRQMPGDPVAAQYEQLVQQGMSPEGARNATQLTYGFLPTGSTWDQYTHYLWRLLHFDLGRSTQTLGVSASSEVLTGAKWTIGLVLAGILLSFALGAVLGVIAAIRRSSGTGDALTITGSLFHAIPQFVMALVLITVFTVIWPVFPTDGNVDILVDPGFNGPYIASLVSHATLPALAYALSMFGSYLLTMKSSVISVLGDDFVLAAELRGLTRGIRFRYVARNALLPLFTIFALTIGFMFGGAVFIEKAFNYPGMGVTLVNSIGHRDYSTMNATFLLITAAVIVANILADLLYTAIDPRVRRGDTAGA